MIEQKLGKRFSASDVGDGLREKRNACDYYLKNRKKDVNECKDKLSGSWQGSPVQVNPTRPSKWRPASSHALSRHACGLEPLWLAVMMWPAWGLARYDWAIYYGSINWESLLGRRTKLVAFYDNWAEAVAGMTIVFSQPAHFGEQDYEVRLGDARSLIYHSIYIYIQLI